MGSNQHGTCRVLQAFVVWSSFGELWKCTRASTGVVDQTAVAHMQALEDTTQEMEDMAKAKDNAISSVEAKLTAKQLENEKLGQGL